MILEPYKPVFLPLLSASTMCQGPLLIQGTQTSATTPLKKPDIKAIVAKTLQNAAPELLLKQQQPPSSTAKAPVNPLANASIRPATSKDIHAIQQFTNTLLKTTYSIAFFLQFLYSKEHYCLIMTLPTSSGQLNIVGVISGQLDLKTKKTNLPAGLALVSGHVYTLAVDPDCRRLGVASQLLNAFVNKLACHAVRTDCILGSLTLEVPAQNFGAIAFYDRSAFFPASPVKKGYYNGAGDALVMKKVLL